MNKTVIDLFSGVGGLSLGFKSEGFKIAIANEMDQDIAASYKKNNIDTEVITEDITKLDIKETFSKFNNICAVIGGPPCQGFSQKGKRDIIDDPRNYLFNYFYEVVKLVRPKYFLIENVPNILTAKDGAFKIKIESLFEKIGYTLNCEILNSVDYGVPQNRKRAIIIGRLGTKKVNMPQKIEKKNTVWDAISDLNYLNSGDGSNACEYLNAPSTEYQRRSRNHSNLLFNHIATSHSKIVIERMKLLPVNGTRDDLPEEHLTKSIYSGAWSRINKNEASVTITTRFDTPSSGKFTHPYLNRALTVREAARIQSFPDDYVFYGSKTSQMKQVGNAVPPLLARAIAKEIKKDLKNE